MTIELDAFTVSYIEAALSSCRDEDDNFLDANYGIEDIAPEALAKIVADCLKFQKDNADDIIEDNYLRGTEYSVETMAGHDFLLTRNDHGVGFWDGDWQEDAANRLNDSAEEYGECDLYVGDDGKIHID